jgi:beta-aspartyl-peptidase (threonine type)
VSERRPCILVHGGAGNELVLENHPHLAQGCLEAARAGFSLLKAGKSAEDAVEAAARSLEDNPWFNAGTGSALTSAGTVEMDASWMEGRNLQAGAVGCVTRLKNPISLARAVAEKTPHVLLVGPGAEAFAEELGFPRVSAESLITPRALERHRRHQQANAKPSFGTIGAVALDARGHVAAATSTGGTSFKRPGRVGDSPLIGLGNYADDEAGAVSCTGQGEDIIKVALAKMACEAARTLPAYEAATSALRRLDRIQGSAGLILVKPDGDFALVFNTEQMSRAWISGDGQEFSAVLPTP